MNNFICASIAIIILFTSGTLFAHAQEQQQSSGAYTMYIGEQMIGKESYVMTLNTDGSGKSEAEVSVGLNKVKAVTIASKSRPISFSIEAGGAKALSAEFSDGAVKIVTPGQPAREVKTQASVILENAVWHHFIFLLAQCDGARGGQQSFRAFLPTQATEFGLQVERVGAPSFTVKGQQVATEHYRALTSQNLVFEMWTDATRTPLVIRIPSQGVKVIRQGSEALAEAILPKPSSANTTSSEAFSSEEVTFQNGEVKLAGTLTVPKKGTAPFPAAVIITGSGGQDRDGANGVFRLYQQIAERLSENGIAVLRADDRGVGKSVAPRLKATSYRDLINDSRAAIEYLQGRGEIDRKRIALVGHSEGALTAMIIASEDSRVAAIALLAGTSRPVDRITFEQSLYMIALQETIDPADRMKLPAISRDLIKLFDEAKKNPKPANPNEDRYAWFREHATSDPLAIAKRVRCPVLILNGERDANVLPYHALELAQALTGGGMGNKEVRLRIFPNLTHLFAPSTLDKSITGEKATEISKEFLQTLQTWATDVLVKGKEAGAQK